MRFIGRTESRSIHESVAVAEKQQEALLLFAISSEISRELMCASACVCMDGRGSGASRSRAKRKARGWFGLWFKIIKRKKKSQMILQMLHRGQSGRAVFTLRL